MIIVFYWSLYNIKLHRHPDSENELKLRNHSSKFGNICVIFERDEDLLKGNWHKIDLAYNFTSLLICMKMLLI